jgi:hypothetical protein
MKQIEIAKKYVGMKEIRGNMGFHDADFDKKMRDVGFQDGHAWCAYAAELVFKEAFPERFDEFDKLFSASAVQTFKNFEAADYTISDKPVEGALVIWQLIKAGEPQWQGHAGICGKVTDGWKFESYEGNTNPAGSREGEQFAKKNRKHLAYVYNGLRVMGFVII